jgi:hypothetical protein
MDGTAARPRNEEKGRRETRARVGELSSERSRKEGRPLALSAGLSRLFAQVEDAIPGTARRSGAAAMSDIPKPCSVERDKEDR